MDLISLTNFLNLEVELNRLNLYGSEDANGVWQATLDYIYKNRIRFSFNCLLDEFVLDDIQKKGKKNEMGHSSRISYSLRYLNDYFISLYLAYLNIGAPLGMVMDIITLCLEIYH